MIVQINRGARLVLVTICYIVHMVVGVTADHSFDLYLATTREPVNRLQRQSAWLLRLSAEAIVIKCGLRLIYLVYRSKLSLWLCKGAVTESVGLQLKFLERQLLFLPICCLWIKLLLIRILISIAYGLLLVQYYDTRATGWIQRLNNLQALLIIVQKWLRSLAPESVTGVIVGVGGVALPLT